MSSVNKVILLGHLGKEPELRYLEHDRMRASFTLATNESYKNKAGEKVTHTTWHNIVLWNALAKIAEQYLTKGKQVYLEGRLTTRAYVDKEGQTKYVTEVKMTSPYDNMCEFFGGNRHIIFLETILNTICKFLAFKQVSNHVH